MARELKSDRKGAAKGAAKQVVVFVHGYGADGADLLGLADPLGPHLPDTVFYSPNAPEKCVGNPFGYQWFPIPWLDGSKEEDAKVSMAAAVEDLNAFLDKVLEEEGLTPDRLALVGFSQGTMMSLHVAPRRDAAIGALVGFSGRLLEPDTLAGEAKVKMPVLLLHGDQDDVVPFASLKEAADALVKAEFETYAFVMKGTGHGIAPDGLGQAVGFLRTKLGLEEG
ncbi:alpha/beta hydrolase [Aliiruegeria sabulilitoris]|uniref:alpha/beta hydrolase n=1 Tax=Aliiruegeria sabulilitoris TaxID=1510458 RepID=UPI00083109DD|nr:dienelactone hydrolase family protein [Aliiruegeria sabulilitoris]NDR55795.1 prolyl oligopeptidase family serine peptidase [Pseudoruegeria sp. M32A2M]